MAHLLAESSNCHRFERTSVCAVPIDVSGVITRYRRTTPRKPRARRALVIRGWVTTAWAARHAPSWLDEEQSEVEPGAMS